MLSNILTSSSCSFVCRAWVWLTPAGLGSKLGRPDLFNVPLILPALGPMRDPEEQLYEHLLRGLSGVTSSQAVMGNTFFLVAGMVFHAEVSWLAAPFSLQEMSQTYPKDPHSSAPCISVWGAAESPVRGGCLCGTWLLPCLSMLRSVQPCKSPFSLREDGCEHGL